MNVTVTRGAAPRAVVLGDLVTDVVLTPAGPLRVGTDVAGTVRFRQGGSAATTARVLASLGVRTALVTALGRDAAGDALERYMKHCDVAVHAVRVGAPTGRLGVIVEPSAERSFVADRGAILRLRPRHLSRAWFGGASLLHLPVYSLLDDGLGIAGERAAVLARAEGAAVTVDLSSAGFIEDAGAARVLGRIRRIEPDVLFANESERAAVDTSVDRLLDLTPVVVLKRGSAGATVCGREFPDPIDVPAAAAVIGDSTGAGDAFDAGFLAAWLADRRPESLARAVLAGHRAARREVTRRRVEFGLGLARPE